jgi:uncharacterized repeat protein (TIGR03803 family)
MKCNRSVMTLGTILVLMATMVLAPAASAQSKFKILHEFVSLHDGAEPLSGLIFDQSGNLYGTTATGRRDANSMVFQLTPNLDGSWTEKVLYQFTGSSDGGEPHAGVILDKAGNLYGTTINGGNVGCGVVFKLTPNADGSWTESVLYSFMGGNDGCAPYAGLIFDQAGNLYGTTLSGGSLQLGTVFELSRSSGGWKESTLYSFKGGNDGNYPYASLIFDQGGNLYGTTIYGGSYYQHGIAFQLTPSPDKSWSEKVLYRFTGGVDGDLPVASLILDQTGNLYGTTLFGGTYKSGTVFQLTRKPDGSWKEKVLHSFHPGGKDGYEPSSGLIFDATGNLYGTTRFGGNLSCTGNGCGVVYKLAPNSDGAWKETVLHNFFDHPAAIPEAGVIFDARRNLYGTTAGAGGTTFGSVFEIIP